MPIAHCENQTGDRKNNLKAVLKDLWGCWGSRARGSIGDKHLRIADLDLYFLNSEDPGSRAIDFGSESQAFSPARLANPQLLCLKIFGFLGHAA